MDKFENQMSQNTVPHVLIFPFLAQAHVSSMLKVAEILSLEGIHITFINFDYNHVHLLRFSDAQNHFAQFPGFRFETITDGLPLPPDQPRTVEYLDQILNAIKTFIPQSFRDMVFSGRLESGERGPVTCIIADGLFSFTIDVAKELGIPSISYSTTSASYFWALYSIPKLIKASVIPFPDGADMDEVITSVPGMEEFLRRKDLPTFCRAKDLDDGGLQLMLTETQKSAGATAHIINTFEDLEAPILYQIRNTFPNIYTIGPLHELLKSRRHRESSQSSFFTSLLAVDRTCMTWLNSQPQNSVIYVSFGSVVFMTQNQMLEIWHGLVNSEKRFLWIIRPDSVTDKDEKYDTPKELREGTKERGYMVEWCPQEEVLAHPSVGGFFTHSGWNSTLETLVAGVPTICLPQIADQQINSRNSSEVWKVGLNLEEKFDRVRVARMVRDVMEDRREEMMRSVDRMAEMARISVSEGGSSYSNMERLIQDIKSMNLEAFDCRTKQICLL